MHVPQVRVPPQPSDAVPQLSPAGHDVAGVQQLPLLHTCPAPQTFPHVPQLLLSVCVSLQVPLHFVPLEH